MGLARSTFYSSGKKTDMQLRDEDLAKKLEEVQGDYYYTIGRRRMGVILKRRYGIDVCETTLQRVMSAYGLGARIRQTRKAKPHAGKATKMQLPANELNRQFKADKPLYRMVTDVTYVPYYENNEWHWGYLSLVQDLFDRSIVSWAFSKKQDVSLSLSTLHMLSFKGLEPNAMLHSDRGSIYTAKAFRELAERLGIRQSYSRTGNCYDNATMECFNGTFKVEALYNPAMHVDNPSFKQQNELIARYIEFYNTKRPCSVIGNMSPWQYRAQYIAKQKQSVLQGNSCQAGSGI